MSLARPIKVVLYAALIGLLLASYVSPLQQISAGREQVHDLNAQLERLQGENAVKERQIEDLNTPEGVERIARERYGMVRPGEQVYIVGQSSSRSD